MKETHSFEIYDASAGSGKTFTLVKEYLKIVLKSKKNDAYRNILAITFTNKAVREMKTRIVDNLFEFTKEIPNKKAIDLLDVLSQELEKPVADLKTKSQQIIKHLIHNYAAFDISTIDKFTHRVIRAFAVDLNLSINFEVTLETDNLLSEAVDALIAKAGEDKILTKLLIDFTLEKTDNDKSWDISREIFETGKLIQNENNRNELATFKNKSIQDFVDIKERLQKLCKQLLSEAIVLANNCNQEIENIGRNAIDINANFSKHLIKLQTGIFNPVNKTFRTDDSITVNITTKNREDLLDIVPSLILLLNQIYNKHQTIGFYNAFLQNITPLSLLNTVAEELKNIQEEQNTLSISEFNAIINKEIQNQPAPFIYERLGERYQHFFIDEFQDTSEMQWLNLFPLIDNKLAGMDDFKQKGTLMIVGDPKQSIYRWRGGKAEQFIELSKSESPFSNKDKKYYNLPTNYRSYSEVINFNNGLFKMLSSEFVTKDYIDLYDKLSHQKTHNKIGGFVKIEFLATENDTPRITEINPDDLTENEILEESLDKTELHCDKTYQIILEVQKLGFAYHEIAILTRKTKHGIAIGNYLTQKNIPILSSETLLIENATEIKQIINVLSYLKNKKDKKAKSNFLYYLGNNLNLEDEIHDFLSKGMELENEKEFEKWLATFNIELSFENIRKKSLYEAVEKIITLFFVKNEQRGMAYIQYFLDIVLEKDMRTQAGISDFLDFWSINSSKFKIPAPSGTNAVEILTIHKSKGLEYPIVIMPFADDDYNFRVRDKIWVPTHEETFGLSKILINNTAAIKNFGKDATEVFEQKKQEELLDNINVLYVALTRAEEQLYIISSMVLDKMNQPKKNTMSGFFINYLTHEKVFSLEQNIYEFGDRNRISEPKKHIENAQSIPLIANILDFKNIKIAQRETMMWGTVQQEAIEFGNVIHEILSLIKTKDDIDIAIDIAIENGWITILQKHEVQTSIHKIVSHPNLKPFFDKNNTILNEQTIIQKNDKTLKPDRMVIDNNKNVYLLDYKTGALLDKHKNQLNEYQIAIEKMGYKVCNKCLVYIAKEINIVVL